MIKILENSQCITVKQGPFISDKWIRLMSKLKNSFIPVHEPDLDKVILIVLLKRLKREKYLEVLLKQLKNLKIILQNLIKLNS